MSTPAASARRTGEAPALGTPQLRTLLLTDLVDSTALVEKLGDSAAAALFRDHDALVLELQQRWRGRLIDRSDGLLLLFERPIDGLGFALDYVRGLYRIGDAHGVPLQARAGLHVGEVLTWRNSDAAVAVGAKPLEVEGLAKPMAGRLMALARPGQLLLSAVAEPLARRAARELGERGEHLLWKSWGRWRFKGVPEAQELYEVGEPGLAPLRAPKATAKAWRDIPLWRRPAALAAEVLVLAGLATGVWFATRPQPAIAFADRDWVVVADLRNLTGDKVLDDSLEQAFRISLEQSRYVNVLSDIKARDTLALMQRKPDTTLDRAIASEIALRDGARAVILPTVAEVGGKVRVSAEVIDPHTQTTVYAESADGTGAASTLGSIDHVTAALRGQLGEALESIEKTSAPLPLVSTSNLDALRAYALGLQAYGRNRYGDALAFFQSATRLDPEFALAWLGQAKAHFAVFDVTGGLPALHRAEAFRSRLAPREALYLDGWSSEFESPRDALDKWRSMAQLYPDYAPADANAAIRLLHANRFAEAVPFAERATMRQYEASGNAHDLLGRAYLALGDFKRASREFDLALTQGNRDSWDKRAMVEAAQRHFDVAQEWLRRAPAQAAPEVSYYRALFSVDQRQWHAARHYAMQAVEGSGKTPGLFGLSLTYARAVTEWLDEDAASARKQGAQLADDAVALLAHASRADAQEVAGIALSAALLADRLDDRATVDKVIAAKVAQAPMDLPDLVELQAVLEARKQVRQGHPARAVELLKPLVAGHERFQTHVALFDAYRALDDVDRASAQARWLAAHRGLAYGELGCYGCQKILNVADTGRAVAYLAQQAQPPRK